MSYDTTVPPIRLSFSAQKLNQVAQDGRQYT